MMNTDFLIPTQASSLRIGDQLYLGEERYGKLLICKSLSPIVVKDQTGRTEYTLNPDETVYLPDSIMEYIYENLGYIETNPNYIELSELMAIWRSADYTEHFSSFEIVENMQNKILYLKSKLFSEAHKAASK